jgi:Domain of unknown function (DUF4167)
MSMHSGHPMKRQRGRGRKPGGGGGGHHNYQHHNNQPNRTMESNGPETKVRGPAAHIYERYLQLARDASASGDRVLGENYLQHADHYFRLLRAMQPAAPPPQADRYGAEGDMDGDGPREDGTRENEAADTETQPGEGDEQPDAEFQQGRQQQPAQERDGEFRRRRGRRNRFRPEGEGAEARTEGEGEPERREQDQRKTEPETSAEGFSNGPKPAFLGSD